MPSNKYTHKRRSKAKKGSPSNSKGFEQSVTDIGSLLNDIEGAEGWYPVVHAICTTLNIPDLSSRSGLKKIHEKFADIAKRLDALYVEGEEEDVVVQAVLAIYIRMCADSILRNRLVKESGLLSKTFALLDRPGCFRVALQALSAVTVHGGKDVRAEIAKRTPSLLTILERHPDDEDVAELALTVLCHSVSAVMSSETTPNPALGRLSDLPRLIPLILRGMQKPTTSALFMSHAIPLLSVITLHGYKEIKASPSAINFLVAFSAGADVLTRSDAILGLLNLYDHQHDDSIPSFDPGNLKAATQSWPDHINEALFRYGPMRTDAYKAFTSSKLFQGALCKFAQDRDFCAFGRVIGRLVIETEASVPNGTFEVEDPQTLHRTSGKAVSDDLGLPFVYFIDALPLSAKALRARGNREDGVLADYLEFKYMIIKQTLNDPKNVEKVKTAIERNPRNGYFHYVLSLLPDENRDCLRAAKRGLTCPNLTDFLRCTLLYRALSLGGQIGLVSLRESRWADGRLSEEAIAIMQTAWEDAKAFLDCASPDNRNVPNAVDWYIILSFALNDAGANTNTDKFKHVFEKLQVAEECLRYLKMPIQTTQARLTRMDLVSRLPAASKEWGVVVRRYSETIGIKRADVTSKKAEDDLMAWLDLFRDDDGHGDADGHNHQDLSVIYPKVNPNMVELYQCSWCRNPSAVLRKCSGCEKTRYCDSSCQKEHWKSHREACKREAEIRTLQTKVERTHIEHRTPIVIETS